MKNVTIGDIAKAAGVSKTTVSRVLNNSGPVNSKTQKRILELIEQYNYTPSSLARNLSRGESSSIAVLVPNFSNPYFAEILQEISSELSKRDLTMICFNSQDSDQKDAKSLNLIKYYRVKGLIYTPANIHCSKEHSRWLRSMLSELNTPIVVMDRRIQGLKKADGVFYDDFHASYEATKAFIQRGHRKIALSVTWKKESLLHKDREEGYLAALKDFGIERREEYIISGELGSVAYEEALRCLRLPDPPTAVLTANNDTTLGLLKAAQTLGLSVPGDLAHIGFERIEGIDFLDENRSYVDRSTKLMGQKVIEMLFNRFLTPNKPYEECILEPKLIIRNL